MSKLRNMTIAASRNIEISKCLDVSFATIWIMTKKIRWTLLVGILIIAGFFRFYHLTATPPGLFMDEAMDGVNAQNVAQTGHFKVYYPEDNGREGLYVNILAVAFKYHILPETAPWSVGFRQR